MSKSLISIIFLILLSAKLSGQGQITVTYTSGCIETDYDFRSLPGFSNCPGTLKVNIPDGNEISGLDVSYTMDGIGYPFQQRSWLYSPTVSAGEQSITSGVGDIRPYNYSRNGLTFANLATGEVEFQLHTGRTHGRSGCDTLYNKVVNNTWVLTVHYVPLPDCPMPFPLGADVDGTTVELSWVPRGSGTAWNVELGYPGFNPGTNDEIEKNYGIQESSWTVEKLIPLTSYEFYVQADCGEGEYSTWSGPYNFSTGCGAYPVPFFEGFEEGHIVYSPVSRCWTHKPVDGIGGWGIDKSNTLFAYPNSGLNFGYLAGGPDYWIFQEILLEEGKNYTFEMYARQDKGDPGTSQITVAYGDTPDVEMMNNIIIPATGITNSTYQLLSGTFSVPETKGYFIGIRGNKPLNTQTYIYIDDISVYETIPGTRPVLMKAENVNNSSAYLTWVCGAGESEIEWGISPFSPGSGNRDNTTENSYSLSGLSEAAVYEFYVRAVWGPGDFSEWAGPYRFATEHSVTAVEVSGSNNADGQYPNLKKAFSAINASDQTEKEINVRLMNDSYEGITPSVIYQGNWASLTICPEGEHRTVYGNVSGNPLIDFNGADMVTINGYLEGLTHGLTLANYSSSSAEGTSTIRFINDAQYNSVEYCKLLGSSSTLPDTDGGTVFFATSVKNGWGNSRDSIMNCIIGPAAPDNLPSKGIYGRSQYPQQWENFTNQSNVITDNEIYDFHLESGCAGIYLRYGNGGWAIEGNKIYQTSSRNMNGPMYGIYFQNAEYDYYSSNRNISRNIIGYSSGTQSGKLSVTGNGSFAGISFNILPYEIINIQDNIISDLNVTSTSGTFYGIINLITTSNNTTLDIKRNIIRRINIYNSTKVQCGIMAGHAKDLTVTENTVSDMVSSGDGEVYGIMITSSLNGKINNNDVFNISSTNPEFSQLIAGMRCVTGNSGNYPLEFKNNTIYNISSSSSSEHMLVGILKTADWRQYGNFKFQHDSIYNIRCYGGGAHIIGMHISYSYTWVQDNVIFDLASTAMSSSGSVTGIQTSENSGVHFIERNKIFNLRSSGENPSISGVHIGSTYFASIRLYNNMISDLQAPNANTEVPVTGIKITNSGYSFIMYNTIYLNAVSTGETFGSAGIFAENASYLDLRNNNIVNISVPKGNGITAAFRNHTSSLENYPSTSNNNNFYAGIPGAHNLIFYDGTNGCESISSYKTRVSLRDDASFSELPPFINTSVKPYDLHIDKTVPTRLESSGVSVKSPEPVEKDINEETRYMFPDVGADEFDGISTMPVHPSSASLEVMSTQEISVSYETNPKGDEVLIVWNTTGVFHAPDGAIPATGEPFAGGNVLSAGLPSPVSHTGLTHSTKYFYKLFSYSGTDYSPGIVDSAVTSLSPPLAFSSAPVNDSRIDLFCRKNAAGNNIIIAANISSSFGNPVNGTPYSPGSILAGGGTVVYSGPDTVVSHTGLSEYTAYYYKIWTVDEFHYYSSKSLNSFNRTSCSVASLPFFEGFETNHSSGSYLTNCWLEQYVSGTGIWSANNTYKSDYRAPRTGSWNALFQGNGNTWLFNGFNLEAGKNYIVELYARQGDGDPLNTTLAVACGISPVAGKMTDIIIPVTGINTGSYQLLSGYFTPVVDGPCYIGINSLNNAGFFSNNNIVLDDITIYEAPSCPAPKSLLAGDITGTSARLSWLAGMNEGSWNVEAGTVGFTPGNNEEAVCAYGINSNEWTADGLNPLTNYEFYVQADCGNEDLSTWAGPHAFKTLCGSLSLPFMESFDSWYFPECWSQTYDGTGTPDKWGVFEYSIAGGFINEMIAFYHEETGTSRLITPPMDMSSVNEVTLEFLHYIGDPGIGCTFKLQSGSDLINWKDEDFVVISGQGDKGPEKITVPITTLSATTYIAWVIEGNNMNFFYWAIDNIVITGNTVDVLDKKVVEHNIRVYPNPSRGQFYIFTEESSVLQIISPDGKVILTEKTEQGINEIVLPEKTPGVYFLRVFNKQQVYGNKIIIK